MPTPTLSRLSRLFRAAATEPPELTTEERDYQEARRNISWLAKRIPGYAFLDLHLLIEDTQLPKEERQRLHGLVAEWYEAYRQELAEMGAGG